MSMLSDEQVKLIEQIASTARESHALQTTWYVPDSSFFYRHELRYKFSPSQTYAASAADTQYHGGHHE